MDIGKEDEPYTIEPVDDPVPADNPLPVPEPELPVEEPVPA